MTSEAEFDAAVIHATKLMDMYLRHRESLSFREATLMGLGRRMIDQSPYQLLQISKEDAFYFDALRLGVSLKLSMNEPLNQDIRRWLENYIRGRERPPFTNAGRRKAYDLMEAVGRTVELLVKHYGLSATRNDQTFPHRSACDAVAAAMRALKKSPMSFRSIKKHWNEYRRYWRGGLKIE